LSLRNEIAWVFESRSLSFNDQSVNSFERNVLIQITIASITTLHHQVATSDC